MKRVLWIYILVAAIMSIAASCVREVTEPEILNQDVQTVVFSASVDCAVTKTVLDDMQSLWSGSESITVLGANSSYVFTADVPEPAATAEFSYTGAFYESSVLAVYPSGDYSSDMSARTVSEVCIPTVQKAVEGSFDQAAAVSIAYTENEVLAFRNVVSLLKFTAGSEGIRSVTVRGKDADGDAVAVSGKGEVSYNDGEPTFFPRSGSDHVGLSASAGETLKSGEAYYIAHNIKRDSGNLNDCAVLYRTNSQSRAIEEALISQGISYRM